MKNLSSKQKKDSLEDLLDASSGQSVGSVDQPAVPGKKHVKAMEALRKALHNEPHLIYKSVEGLVCTVPFQTWPPAGRLPEAGPNTARESMASLAPLGVGSLRNTGQSAGWKPRAGTSP